MQKSQCKPTPSDPWAGTCQVGCGSPGQVPALASLLVCRASATFVTSHLGQARAASWTCHPHAVPAQGWGCPGTCVTARCKKKRSVWESRARACSVELYLMPWAVALQAPLSMGFSRQESWSGLPCPLPGDLPDSGIEPASPASPALQVNALSAEPPGESRSQEKGFLT